MQQFWMIYTTVKSKLSKWFELVSWQSIEGPHFLKFSFSVISFWTENSSTFLSSLILNLNYLSLDVNLTVPWLCIRHPILLFSNLFLFLEVCFGEENATLTWVTLVPSLCHCINIFLFSDYMCLVIKYFLNVLFSEKQYVIWF